MSLSVKPQGRIIHSQKLEIVIGIVLFVTACFLLYDAYDGRGKKMPWPFGGLAPW